VIALMGFVALAGCQSVDRPGAATAAREAASEPAADQVDRTASAASTSAYPSLHTVPPRPRLSYSVEQRRAIVDGLVADRENARYTDQVVRYRSGQSSLPPPPAPPTAVAAVVPEGLVEPPRAEAAPDEPVAPGPTYGDDDDRVFGRQYGDDDTLSDFVDELARDTAEQPLGEPAPAGSAGSAGSDPEDAGGDGPGWLDWLGDLFGQTEVEAADPAGAVAAAPAAAAEAAAAPIRPVDDDTSASIQAAWRKEAAPAFRPGVAGERVDPAEAAPSPAAEPLPAEAMAARPDPDDAGIAIGESGVAIGESGVAIGDSATGADDPLPPDAPRSILVRFEPGSASLPPGAGSRLEQLLATAKAQGAVIRIEGEAEAPALALDRAHAVALGLMRLGARARDLEMALAPAATGDQARVVLTGPAAR
jgi:hypothetical protein